MEKILIIEDDLILLNLLKTKLIKANYNIIFEKNGFSGLKTAEKEFPDLILLDIILPEMDGITVLQNLKNNPKTKNIPIIIISNSGQQVEIEKIKKIGADDYLIKTEFDPGEVLLKIEGILKNKEKIENTEKETEKPKDEILSPKNEKKNSDEPKKIQDSKQNRVLIIEDDKFLREIIAQKLNKEGIETILSITAEDAVQLLAENIPHLILLDLLLPGMNGFELLKQIKADPNLSHIPVIILSNLGEDKDKDTAIKLGAKDFMVKAMFTPNEIVDKIKKTLEESYV